MFKICGDVGRGISRIWVVWWIDRVEGGKGRWKFRISVSADTVIADMARNANKTAAGDMDMRGNGIVLLEKYDGREVCQLS
jgi:UPF0288 family protein (methanogenesis marker protein 3)